MTNSIMPDLPDLVDIGINTATDAGVLGIYLLVGPSLRAVGNAFGDWTDYRVRNLLRIGAKAKKRLGPKELKDPQPLHPRYAK